MFFCLIMGCKSESKEHTYKVEDSKSDQKIAEVSSPVKQKLEPKDVTFQIDSIAKQANPTEVKTEIKKKEVKTKSPAPELSKTKGKTASKKKKKAKKSTAKKPVQQLPKPMAKIEFEELTWDFGEITEGDIVGKKFRFTNTGNANLEILATTATCGCTRPTFPFIDIHPGESNVIGVSYNSVGKEGDQNPEITVESNTYPKITTIKLTGTVKPKPKKEEEKASLKDSTEAPQDTIAKQ